ncbi:MAG TPA: lysylphosphatidylglycerol synthase transmembrane domain-containing protein [Flexilinea sp.]|nr:lysylphosphatidylglycerol synthase transmembrane domain-containing protein [Flexilinea sp.]
MSDEPDKKKSGIWKQMLPGILISVVIILILVFVVDFGDLIASFRNVSVRLIMIVFALQSVAFIFRALAWRVTLEGIPTWAQCFWTVTEGYLLNLLPLRLGEIGRAVIMGGVIHRSPFFVFSTVLLERLFDVIITLIMLLATIPLVSGADFSPNLYYVLISIFLIGLVLLFLIAKNQENFVKRLEKIIKPESKFGRFLYPKLQSLLNGLSVLAQPKKFIIWLFWILMTWVCWIATMLVCMHAFFPNLPVWSSLFVQSITALGGAIPSAPAGLGVIEGAFVAALRIFGINQSEALGFGMFNHSMGIITPVIWGLIGFAVQGQSFSQVFSGLRKVNLSEEDAKND